MTNYSPYFGDIIVNDKISPVIVFTVGKVASKTVTESIFAMENIPYSVYHAHVLSPKILNFNDIENQEKNFDATNKYLAFNLKLSKFINENIRNYKWRVITLVREPISIILSTFFEFLDTGKTIQDLHPEIFKNGKLDISYDDFIQFFNTKFAYMTGDYIIKWFDLEMREVFGIDVYSHEFDHSKGYSIIKEGNVELLTIRLEDLNKVFQSSMKEFLGIDNIVIVQDNVAENRHYANHISFLKDNLEVFDYVCKHFYESKFAKHFYSEKEISLLIDRWMTRKNFETNNSNETGISKENIFGGLKLWDLKTGVN